MFLPTEREIGTGQIEADKRVAEQYALFRSRRPARSVTPAGRLKAVGLFAGIGGLELGLGAAGHETLLLCEIDPGARAVLEAHISDVPVRADVRKLRSLPSETELLVAGFPCQDLSQAGKTEGITGESSGLVRQVFRLLRRQRVPWVLLENVPFMLQLSRGRALDVIVSELEALGYRWAYRVMDSRAFGLPQRRQRVFMLATRDGDPRDVLLSHDAGEERAPVEWNKVACGFYWTEGIRGLGWAVDGVPTLKGGSTVGIPSPPAIILPDGRVVKPDICDAERLQGFDPDWTKPAEAVTKRGHRWKLVGNAVTVPVARWIGECLVESVEVDPGIGIPLVRRGAWPQAAWNVGKGRFAAEVSTWPVCRAAEPLQEFLRFPTEMLSARATAGFLGRARSGTLRFPPGFLDRVGEHLARVERSAQT